MFIECIECLLYAKPSAESFMYSVKPSHEAKKVQGGRVTCQGHTQTSDRGRGETLVVRGGGGLQTLRPLLTVLP